jgi:signal transduction histidine kinase
MFSGTGKASRIRSAAWRVSLLGTVAFACGTLVIFMFLQAFVAKDIQRRSDAWLSGEVETLGDVAARTPKNALYGRVVGEIAELASREIPNRPRAGGENHPVFFLKTTVDGSPALWVGAGDGAKYLEAIRKGRIQTGTPFDVRVPGAKVPYRVATAAVPDGSRVYLGLSERDERRVLHQMRERFLSLWLLDVLLGFVILFLITRSMLGDVRKITEAAASIGESDLSKRVPTSGWNDEIAQLAMTLNRMLERIEQSVHQLHTMTNSLAHDLRSPLTAIRARLEMALTHESRGLERESLECAIDEVDRLTEMLNQSLDVAEAEADALRLEPATIDLEELLVSMIDLYQPCMDEKGLRLEFRSAGPVKVQADAALLHRMVANLFDNEIKHLPASRRVMISLSAVDEMAQLVLEDDGPGFAPEIVSNLFGLRVKGQTSPGYGLGLAFVQAVTVAHGGTISAENRAEGGARLILSLPLAAEAQVGTSAVTTSVA